MRALIAVLVAGLVLLPTSLPASNIPTQITIQGKLTDASGTPLPAGLKQLTFRIFDAQILGSEVWPGGSGEIQTLTTGADGLWIAFIGALIPLTDDVFTETARWLEVTVYDGINPAVTMPRICLVSGPFAFRVATIDGASGGTITSKLSIGEGHTNTGDHAFLAGYTNTASGPYSTVPGGAQNSATNDQSVVSGGALNTAAGQSSTVGGGWNNHALANDATIAGGVFDTAAGLRSTIAGGHMNYAGGERSTVSGGSDNRATNDQATVSGGAGNLAKGVSSVVSGGWQNAATGGDAFVGGGVHDSAFGDRSVVVGGHHNLSNGSNSTVGGGEHNRADDYYATVAGGTKDTASGIASTVSGGVHNVADGDSATVSGGADNAAAGIGAVISGGIRNDAVDYGSVAGGRDNSASGSNSTVGGGDANTAADQAATVAGGQANRASFYGAVGGGHADSALGQYACVPGGAFNKASGDYSMAAGRRARAAHAGTFVWADNHDASVQSVRTNEFVVRAENGLRLTDTAGAAEAIDKGVYFRDNAIVAWAKVNATGVAYGHDFGISNITRNSAGNYWIVVDADAAVADNLIAVATVEVESPPISAATARLIYVTQNGINNFYVHITNGSHVATDNDFMIMVTAR